MEIAKKKMFVLKATFEDFDISGKESKTYEGNIKKRFDVLWRIRVETTSYGAYVHLDCLKARGHYSWNISTEINGKIGENKEDMNLKSSKVTYPNRNHLKCYSRASLNQFLTDGSLRIKLKVEITNMRGVHVQNMRNFDDEFAKEHSDVILKVGNQEFHVYKSYLSLHSSYFNSLFSGNFAESRQSEIELKGIDAEEMQKFLEVLYGELVVDDDTVDGILKLGDMYDAKTAIRHCEQHLMGASAKSLKEKLAVAIQYKLDDLKDQCISEAKTKSDLLSLIPNEGVNYSQDIWKELYEKALNS